MHLTRERKTGTIAWSPAVPNATSAPLLAVATVAGALDKDFSTATTLELFDPLSDKAFKKVGSVSSTARFNRIAWGPGIDSAKNPMGIIAGGLENGDLCLWDARTIIDSVAGKDPLIMKPVKHKGPVRGLDFNAVDSKFIASGAADGELFVWDLTNPAKPYSPGARSNRLEDITAVAWNRMYHYILASASNNGNTVIWDLRNRNEIAAFSHPGGRKQISSIAWNPDSPTQIVTASDDDANPVILMWDLRNSRAPEKVLTGHSKGILNLAWCPKDSDLLLSCGKDNRTVLWNPSTATMIGDVHHSSNWTFEANWCPRNPDLVAIAGFDGIVSVHSLQARAGDSHANDSSAANAQPTSTTAAALSQDPHDFITGGGFGSLGDNLQHQDSFISDHSFTLPFAPKWLKRPVGCSWGFGNRLVSFVNKRQPDGTVKRTVAIQNVVSEPAFVARASELEQRVHRADASLSGGANVQEWIDFCQSMAAPESSVLSEKDRDMWRFLGVMFETGSREQVLQFLGFDKADVASTDKLAALLAKLLVSTEPEPVAVVDKTVGQQMIEGGVIGDTGEVDDFALIASQTKQATAAIPPVSPVEPATPFKLYSNAPGENADTDALVMKALVLGNFETAVRICIGANRYSDALMFAGCGGPDLLSFAQQHYFKHVKKEKSYMRVLHNIVEGDLHDLVEHAHIDGPGSDADWKDLLALICTYAKAEDLSALFSQLGRRLEAIALAPTTSSSLKTMDWKGREEKKSAAVLCYLVAGDLPQVLHLWALRESEEEKLLKTVKNAKSLLTSQKSGHALALQSLIEKVHVFRRAIEFVDTDLSAEHDPSSQYSLEALYQRYVEYAQVAASQGLVSLAWQTLQLVPPSFHSAKVDSSAVDMLRDRILNSGLVREAAGVYQAQTPFEVVDLLRPAAPAPAPVQAQGYGYSAAPPSTARYPSASGYNQYANNAGPYGGAYQPSQQQQHHQQLNGNQYGQPSTARSNFAPPPPQSGYPQMSPSYSNPGNQYNQFGYPAQNSFGRAGYGADSTPPPPPPVTAGYQAALPPPPPASAGFQPPAPPAAHTGYQSQGHPSAFAPPPPTASSAAGYPPVAPPGAVRSASFTHTFAAPQPVQQSATYNAFPGQVTAPPPSSSVPPQTASQPVTPAGPQRHSSGDRAHIKPAQMPIVTGLDTLMATCKATKINPQQKREWEDTEKKVLNLFDQLNNAEVADDIVGKLQTMVKALQAGEYAAAHKLQVELMTTRFTATSSWIVGVKRVIDTLERSELDKMQSQQLPQQQQQQHQQQQQRMPPPPQVVTSPTLASPYGHQSGPSYGAPPPKAAGVLPPPPPASSMPYGGGSAPLPPPPTANAAPYGGNALSAAPRAAPGNPYGAPPTGATPVPPPPTAASAPYGGGAGAGMMSPRGNPSNGLGAAPRPPPQANSNYPSGQMNTYANPGYGNAAPGSSGYGNAPPQSGYVSAPLAGYANAPPPPSSSLNGQYGSASSGAQLPPPPPPASLSPYGGRF
ncbi:hypothetical protein CcCBS67573_g03486 [Chytriomyces confervae]|uniref:Protein transport protein SEC31 n=1 Tax=Chytriomyces confervae TaxID=246404 RepID=A0A507FG64_9FUNG|nr:protein transport protein S31 [Chytriomyces hyalinus]TPX75233.1 hypothetical protein CcCBS67573_g03486 [Chytriomyces confervae]